MIALLDYIESQGFEVKRNKMVCPFHGDSEPSLSIRGERWKCFGCGAGGDVIDFVQKLHGVNFKNACEIVGKKNDYRIINLNKLKQKGKEKIDQTIGMYTTRIGKCILHAHRLIDYTQDNFELYHRLSIWEYHLEIAVNGSDEEKYELYKIIKGEK